MRILVFSWRDPKHPLAGGAEQLMHEHMKGWIKAGHEVTLFSSKMKGLSRKEMLDGVRIVRQGYQYWGVQLAALFYWLENCKNFDFVVDQFHGIPFFTPLYVRKPKLAVLQEVAREVWLKNPLPIPLNWIVGLIGYFGEFFVFQLYRSTPFMVGSNSAKDDLVKMGIKNSRIAVVPHGVIIQKPDPMPKRERIKTVVFLGVLTKDKGIEEVIKTFSILDKLGNYQFWVIGGAETRAYHNKIMRLTKRLGLERKVKFWGGRDKVSQKKKFELLARAHVMINPSIREGFGLVNVEANAMRTPVVAYRSPGLIDSVRHGQSGLIVSQNTPSMLAKKVANLLRDQVRYNKLCQGAKKWASGFPWSKSRKKSLALVEEVAS